MQKLLWPALAAVALVGPSAYVEASEIEDFAHQCRRDYLRNNAFPEPFIYPDRAAAWAPFAVMIRNGWRMQNTLGNHHFREGTTELTEAGKLKVLWILTDAPPQHRAIFVERAGSPEATGGRLQNVQTVAQSLAVDGIAAPVFETNTAPRGWPADEIDVVSRRHRETAPDPRLPARSSEGSGN